MISIEYISQKFKKQFKLEIIRNHRYKLINIKTKKKGIVRWKLGKPERKEFFLLLQNDETKGKVGSNESKNQRH